MSSRGLRNGAIVAFIISLGILLVGSAKFFLIAGLIYFLLSTFRRLRKHQ